MVGWSLTMHERAPMKASGGVLFHASRPKGGSMRVRCGWQGGRAALVLVAVAGVAAISPTGPAGAAANYHGVATADAARVTVIVPNAPATSSIVDTGLTSAQAVVTSGGTSKAYGSNPYPGDNAVTLPGTLAGFGVAGVPQYPLYAESVNPDTPKAEIGNGPFHLLATSTATTSDGLATSGQRGEQNALLTSALASVHQEADGAVTSRSESKVQGFAAGPLKIASITSSATAKLPATGGARERASSLEVTGLSVNDVAVQLTPKGLVVKDQTVPADGKAVEEALSKANVSVSYIAPEDTPNGVVGAGLRVSSTFTVPGNAPSQVVWLFGRALALIDAAGGGSAVPDVGSVGGDVGSTPTPGPPPSAQPMVSPAAPPSVEAAASSGALSPNIGLSPARAGFASLPAAPLDGSGSAPAAAPAAPGPAEAALAPAPAPAPRPLGRASVTKGDDSGLYLLLVAGAAAAFVLAQLFGAVGVRAK
jgi:hypothetical protein